MNRERFIPRIVADEEGPVRLPEGTERGRNLALAFAEQADEGLIEALLQHFAALNQFGGQLYVGAVRQKFDHNGNLVSHAQAGSYETVGFVFHYSKTARVRGQVDEPDRPYGQSEPPELEVEANGAPPEPVPVAEE